MAKFCYNCGNPIKDGNMFCSNCGTISFEVRKK